MADVIFQDFTIEVQGAIDNRVNIALEEVAGDLEAQVKLNTRVDTGKTYNSWRHVVDDEKHLATVGSSEENAIWEEFGTGEQALNGDGRKGWTGKSPSRAFFHAFNSMKNGIIKHLQDSLRGV